MCSACAKHGWVCPMQGIGNYDKDKIPARPSMLSLIFEQYALETKAGRGFKQR